MRLITDIAENSEYLSLRGTGIYVLGLLSKTAEGKKELSKYGWHSSGNGTLVCLPKNSSVIFQIKKVDYKGSIT